MLFIKLLISVKISLSFNVAMDSVCIEDISRNIMTFVFGFCNITQVHSWNDVASRAQQRRCPGNQSFILYNSAIVSFFIINL